ncbi:hypothetical protein CBS63078_7365 [Aspergillus niger]|nr:hypothetical protein CBS11232_425 [Aspergillus niger]KAI2899139.1 hypothetical protein CBS63078_7365 [Aspergillus niger]KAI2957632.1 hypothetical protein CBS147323_8964 [Aspergillus niger]KAI3044618.1 hypothetical protein CBS76997_5088 [Aspergillus niger]KAI3063337.1 hypothetical protein CBS147353_9162 [Aspergillus niger]
MSLPHVQPTDRVEKHDYFEHGQGHGSNREVVQTCTAAIADQRHPATAQPWASWANLLLEQEPRGASPGAAEHAESYARSRYFCAITSWLVSGSPLQFRGQLDWTGPN